MHGYGPSKGAGSAAGLAARSHPARCCHSLLLLAQALVRWGGAMLELAHFKQGSEADDYIKEVSQQGLPPQDTPARRQPTDTQTLGARPAGWCSGSSMCAGCVLEPAHPSLTFWCCVQAIAKLEQALTIDDKCTDAMWCLGNAYTSLVRSQAQCTLAASQQQQQQMLAAAGVTCPDCSESLAAQPQGWWPTVPLSTTQRLLQAAVHGLTTTALC